MANVISMPNLHERTIATRAAGAAIAATLAARRHGHSERETRALSETAQEMVRRGFSAARAVAAVCARARRTAPPPSAA